MIVREGPKGFHGSALSFTVPWANFTVPGGNFTVPGPNFTHPFCS